MKQLERDFWDSWDGDPNKVIEFFLPCIKSMARRFYKTLPNEVIIDIDELVNECCIEIIKMVDRFDLSQGYTFLTFASLRLLGAMKDYCRRLDFVPHGQRKKQNKGQKIVDPSFLSINRDVVFITDSGAENHWLEPIVLDKNKEQKKDFLKLICKGLNKQERILIISYYFLDQTLKQISESFGVSQTRVGAMHSDILDRLEKKYERSMLADCLC